LAQGVSAAQYGNIDPNPAAQYNGRIGGDPTLQPETATTKSFGIGWTPSFLEGFRVQVDYFDIDIKDTIQRIGPETVQQLCSNNGLLCDRIHRDVNGSLWISPTANIDDPLDNQGALRTSGIDVDMSYRFAMGSFGKMNVGLVGTRLQKYEITSLQSRPDTKFDCAGYYGNSCNANVNAPLYKWRHTLRATWSTPWHGLDLGLAWRHLDSVTVDSLSSNPNLNGGVDPATAVADGFVSSTDAKIKAINYLDVNASINLMKGADFRIGINNVLDKSPPIVGSSNCSGCNGNVYSQTYDTLGRYIFGTLSVQF
jgi:outer membrane receptor protein involved in Fe transport